MGEQHMRDAVPLLQEAMDSLGEGAVAREGAIVQDLGEVVEFVARQEGFVESDRHDSSRSGNACDGWSAPPLWETDAVSSDCSLPKAAMARNVKMKGRKMRWYRCWTTITM